LIGPSSGNLIEENTISGNTNGILIFLEAVNNVIRRNVIAGNPPGQVSRTFGATIGFDIRDISTVADTGTRNKIRKNCCLTYSGPGPSPCPNLPGRRHDDDDDEENDD
jgi:parallel beta-helix repeat protein